MSLFKPVAICIQSAVLLSAALLILIGCAGSSGPKPGEVVGVDGSYNYSPSVIQIGTTRQFWWCAGGTNPSNSDQSSDTIRYQSINTVTHASSRSVIVLAETAGTWDSAYTCNPRVIRGKFVNPLGDGRTWAYEMFYVATSNIGGIQNSIGAAFSDDGLAWTKFPQPVITSTDNNGYGVGQPAAYNRDGKSNIVLFYEDSHLRTHHVKAVSTDGLHFSIEGTLTMKGLDADLPYPNWGDMGYDPSTGYWYATFEMSLRNAASTDGKQERGPYGIQLYRIPDAALLTGSTPWTLLKSIDTNLTGYESNFLPSLLHDLYGNLNIGAFPSIQLFPSISDPAPDWNASEGDTASSGGQGNWIIGSYLWTPGKPLLALTRYVNSDTYEVTTGWTDPGAGFKQDAALGHLFEAPQADATVPLYNCKIGSSDYYVSLDRGCDGNHIQGLEGYGYARPSAGVQTVPLYRCQSQSLNHFISHDPQCEGRGTGLLLAYGQP